MPSKQLNEKEKNVISFTETNLQRVIFARSKQEESN